MDFKSSFAVLSLGEGQCTTMRLLIDAYSIEYKSVTASSQEYQAECAACTENLAAVLPESVVSFILDVPLPFQLTGGISSTFAYHW